MDNELFVLADRISDDEDLDEVMQEMNPLCKNHQEAAKSFALPLSTVKLYDGNVRQMVYKIREKAAREAFAQRDWLKACECAGLQAEPFIDKTETRDCDEFSLVKITYHLAETCGYTDSPYHTGYNKEDEWFDVYKVDKEGTITCLAGEKSCDAIGLDDVFLTRIRYADGKVEIRPVGDGYDDFYIDSFKADLARELEEVCGGKIK